MYKTIAFTVEIEVLEEDQCTLEDMRIILNAMEEIVAKKGYYLYDSTILDDGDYVLNLDEDDCGELKENEDFTQDNCDPGYDGILDEG